MNYKIFDLFSWVDATASTARADATAQRATALFDAPERWIYIINVIAITRLPARTIVKLSRVCAAWHSILKRAARKIHRLWYNAAYLLNTALYLRRLPAPPARDLTIHVQIPLAGTYPLLRTYEVGCWIHRALDTHGIDFARHTIQLTRVSLIVANPLYGVTLHLMVIDSACVGTFSMVINKMPHIVRAVECANTSVSASACADTSTTALADVTALPYQRVRRGGQTLYVLHPRFTTAFTKCILTAPETQVHLCLTHNSDIAEMQVQHVTVQLMICAAAPARRMQTPHQRAS